MSDHLLLLCFRILTARERDQRREAGLVRSGGGRVADLAAKFARGGRVNAGFVSRHTERHTETASSSAKAVIWIDASAKGYLQVVAEMSSRITSLAGVALTVVALTSLRRRRRPRGRSRLLGLRRYAQSRAKLSTCGAGRLRESGKSPVQERKTAEWTDPRSPTPRKSVAGEVFLSIEAPSQLRARR